MGRHQGLLWEGSRAPSYYLPKILLRIPPLLGAALFFAGAFFAGFAATFGLPVAFFAAGFFATFFPDIFSTLSQKLGQVTVF